MNAYYFVTRVLKTKSHYSPRATGYGATEIRPGDSDLPSERVALQESEDAFNEHPTGSPVSMRISVIVKASGAAEADREAEHHFDDVLDVLDGVGIQFARHQLSAVGFVRNLSNGQVWPRLPQWLIRHEEPGMVTIIKRGQFIPPSLEQTLFIYSPTDLGKRFKRSLHWRRKARLEANSQLRVLFRWFAMECIWNIYKDDNVSPRIRWCLGFPNGKRLCEVDANLMQNIRKIDGYQETENDTKSRLDDIRHFRIDTVHYGMRQIDCPLPKLIEFDRLTYFACIDVHNLVKIGLQSGIATTEELLERLPSLFNEHFTPDGIKVRVESLRSDDLFHLM